MTPASLYVYVADRRELMALAHDLAVADVDLPTDADGDWRTRLELLVNRSIDALAAHGDIATISRTDLAAGPNSLRIIEEMLRLLQTGGVPDKACAWAVDLFGQYIASSALEDAHNQPPDAFSTLSAEAYPTIHALGSHLTTGDPTSRAIWRLRVLVDGILAQPQ